MDFGIQTPSFKQESQDISMEESFEIIASGSQCNRETVSIFLINNKNHFFLLLLSINSNEYIEFISKW